VSAPRSPSSTIEVEWQLDALDLRPVERWFAARVSAAGENEVPAPGRVLVSLPGLEVTPRPAKRLLDEYFDTVDWRLGRSGHVLRTRQRLGRYEATLKDQAASTDGLRRRLEVTEPLPTSSISDLDPEGPVGRRVRALAGARALRQVLEVRTRRRPFTLTVHGAPVGEVALDDTVIVVGTDRHRLRLQRVEVEVLPAWVESLAPLVERLRIDCGLQPATLSKFEAGLLAAGVAIPRGPDLGSTEITPASGIGDLAYAVLRKDAASMIAHEPGTRLGDDPEDLHQMRVATRRLRAALALFEQVLPVRAVRLREELGWLAAVLGAVRDLDIQLERIDGWTEDMSGDHHQALDELGELLVRHHSKARVDLLEALDSRRFERLAAGLAALLEAGPSRRIAAVQQNALLVLPELINARHRSAKKAARRAEHSGVVGDFHALRIRCKRLRYAIEFTDDLYRAEVKRYAKEIASLQDALGLIQDAEMAAGRLQDVALSEEGELLSHRTIFAMGMVAQRCTSEVEKRLAELRSVRKVVSGPGWHRAEALMEKRRAEAEESIAKAAAAATAARLVPVEGGGTGRLPGRVRSTLPESVTPLRVTPS